MFLENVRYRMLEVNSVEAFFNGDIKIHKFDDHVANQARAHQIN